MLSALLLLITANIIPSLPSSGLTVVLAFYYQESLLDFPNPGVTNYYIPSVTCSSPDKHLIFTVSHNTVLCIASVQFSHSVVFNSLWPCGPYHARPPCPSPTPGVYSNSSPLSRWCHPTTSSSVIPFSCLQSFPATGPFQMSQLFISGGQSIKRSYSVEISTYCFVPIHPRGTPGAHNGVFHQHMHSNFAVEWERLGSMRHTGKN